MILPRDLTTLERSKLDVIRQELLGKFRRRVIPVFKRAGGTVEAIKPRVKYIPLRDHGHWRERLNDRLELISQCRGISWMAFIDQLIREVAANMGVPLEPEPLGRGTVTVIPPETPLPKMKIVTVGARQMGKTVDAGRATQFLLCDEVSA